MPPSNAALVPNGGRRKTYKISPDAKLTRSKVETGSETYGFYKDVKSGRLFRLGAEEFFLLTQLERGRDFDAAVTAFHGSFGKSVRRSTVAGFAAQMVAAGVLVEVTQPEASASETPANDIDDASLIDPAGVEVSHSGNDSSVDAEGSEDVPDDVGEHLEWEGISGEGRVGQDEDIDTLEDLIFAGTDASSRPKPKPSTTSFRAAAAAAATAAAANRVVGNRESSRASETSDRDTQAASDSVSASGQPRQSGASTFGSLGPRATQAGKDKTPEPSSNDASKPDDGTPQASDAASDSKAKRPFFRKTGLHDGVPRKPAQGANGGGGDGGSGSGDSAPFGAAEPEEQPVRQIADKAVAGRKLKFEQNSDQKAAARGIIKLINPTGLFGFLNRVFGWTSWFRWLIWPLTMFAFMAVFTRLTEYGTSITNARGAVDLFWRLLISTLTVNFCTALFTGLAIQRHGGSVPVFGVRMLFFVVPRFAVDESGVRKLERESKLAVYATTMRTRLFLFAILTIFWAFTRHSQTLIPDIALLVSQIALFTLVFTAFPLMSGDGYKYLTTYFRQDMLKQRAHAWLFKNNQSKMGFSFPEPSTGEKRIFVFYTVGSLLFSALVVTFLFIWASTALVGRFGGSGVAIFFALLAAIGLWMLSMRSKKDKAAQAAMQTIVAEKMAERKAQGGGMGAQGGAAGGGFGGMAGGMGGGLGRQGMGAGMAAGMGGGMAGASPQSRAMVPVPQGGRALALNQSRDLTQPGPRPLPGLYAENTAKSRRGKWISRLVLLGLLGGLTYLALQPYDFEVGGDFIILPDTRIEVGARVAGELVEIHVNEGDVVDEGQLLARMSDWEPRLEVEVRIAELAQAEARLQDLRDGASAEEITVAQEKIARAEAELPFLRSQAERAEELLARTAISRVEYERYRVEYETGLIDLRSAQANLAEVVAPASAPEIAVIQAEIDRLTAELAFYRDQLSKVELRATADGRIVTENVSLLRGKYLQVGELFVEIEDHEIARAEVRVSETDIGLVELGDVVRLKAWAVPDEERLGTVVSIAPSAEVEEFGRVVRVKTQFPNEQGFFRPEMTGFAKIEGIEMKTWEAFTRLFVRFFQIEVWGWIP